MGRFHKDMTLIEIITAEPKSIQVFEQYGLSCAECMGAQAETVEKAAEAHGLSVNEILTTLNTIK